YLPIGGIVLLIISTALISMGSSCLAPTTMGLTSRLADVSEQGSILGIAQSFASLGRMIGPFIGGAAYDYAGHKSPYYFAFVLMAVAAVMAFILKSRDLKLDEAPVAMEPVAEV
ncbi:MAG TPA: MFS transporter, partial [bacterium]|nr:MFS transporter [bacterium]